MVVLLVVAVRRALPSGDDTSIFFCSSNNRKDTVNNGFIKFITFYWLLTCLFELAFCMTSDS